MTMVYPGLFNYLPNEDAALRLIQEVPAGRARSRLPAASFLLGGTRRRRLSAARRTRPSR